MRAPSLRLSHLLFVAAMVSAGCDVTGGVHIGPDSGSGANDPYHGDKIQYRNLDTHPGCSVHGLTYTPASIPGYRCAAKEYPFPSGVTEDKSKPIVLLVHGNSDTPSAWERYPAKTGMPMLSEQLVAKGFHTVAVDLRIDLVDDPQGNNDTENAARNIDHGWAVPIVQSFFTNMMNDYPGRRFDVVAFSIGVTVARDALRRMQEAGLQPFSRIQNVVLLAGANHGVSTFSLCASNPTMRGRVTCELGSRDNYTPTKFLMPLNGPNGAYETPCSDGDTAFGETGACAGNVVHYTTVVMRDLPDGTYQDQFVSEASSHLKGADNHLIGLSDTDQSGYFFKGLFKNHYGSCRSAAALKIIMSTLLGN